MRERAERKRAERERAMAQREGAEREGDPPMAATLTDSAARVPMTRRRRQWLGFRWRAKEAAMARVPVARERGFGG